jgi:hypothetical protein
MGEVVRTETGGRGGGGRRARRRWERLRDCERGTQCPRLLSVRGYRPIYSSYVLLRLVGKGGVWEATKAEDSTKYEIVGSTGTNDDDDDDDDEDWLV